ncbi:uncharacterized protein CCOS01_01420, partial [Colletotrichum costaricense]
QKRKCCNARCGRHTSRESPFFPFCYLFLSLALRISAGGSDTFFFFFLHNTVGDLGVDMAFIRTLLLLSFLEASDTYFPLLQPRVSGFLFPIKPATFFFSSIISFSSEHTLYAAHSERFLRVSRGVFLLF